jgi:hypothetical protein
LHATYNSWIRHVLGAGAARLAVETSPEWHGEAAKVAWPGKGRRLGVR